MFKEKFLETKLEKSRAQLSGQHAQQHQSEFHKINCSHTDYTSTDQVHLPKIPLGIVLWQQKAKFLASYLLYKVLLF